MAKEKEQTWQQWARSHMNASANETPSKLFRGCLGALTGTDVRALNAFVACLQLHYYADHPDRALDAARLALGEMQESTRWIARELIPFVLDWDDRERLWSRLALGGRP
jgi:hypothetical protein